jgi:glycosidase
LAEFDALVDRIHTAGMKALIDFVPNHVARGYNSVVKPDLNFGVDDDTTRFFHRDNHFFYLVDPPGQKLSLSKPDSWTPPDGFEFDGEFALEDGSPGRPPKATGNNVTLPNPSVGDWYETVKLNYGYNFTTQAGDYSPRPRTWNTADQILAYWQALGVVGFRCDFAHFLPAEAWSYLIGQSRLRDSEAFFFAEAYPFDGSGDPITEMRQLIRAGFDAVYNDASYDRLKLVYQGRNGLDHYDQAMVNVPLDDRVHSVEYLENHDERRIASPVTDGGPDDSGFGTAEAGYQLAPLQFLAGAGPVLLLNGQEVGEAGAGAEGFGGDDGRTTIFDYWCMPELAKWVNGHAFDGGLLTAAQKSLRNFYADLLALCQDRAVRADGHWGLKYFNR